MSLAALLIVDDPLDVPTIREQLGEGVHFDCVGTLAEGMKRLEGSEYRLILSDLNLADAQSESTIEQLLHSRGSTPLVLMSFLSDRDLRHIAQFREGFRWIGKEQLTEPGLGAALLGAIEAGTEGRPGNLFAA